MKESTFSSDIIRPLTVRQKKTRDNAYDNRFAGAYLGGIVPWPPFLTLPFSKKEQNYWCQATEICQTLLMVFEAYGQGLIQGGKMRGSLCILSSAIFKNIFGASNFSTISNLFDCNTSLTP